MTSSCYESFIKIDTLMDIHDKFWKGSQNTSVIIAIPAGFHKQCITPQQIFFSNSDGYN